VPEIRNWCILAGVKGQKNTCSAFWWNYGYIVEVECNNFIFLYMNSFNIFH
jgi:hypothetical protein